MKQIKNLVNDAVRDALGKSAALHNLDASDIVSLGKVIANAELYDAFYGALANRIVKTVYFVRAYAADDRKILRDEHEFGAFVQKVYYHMPEAVDNPSYEIPDGEGAYKQASPYDVEGTVAISAVIYGGQGTWTIEVVRPMVQIETAFTSDAAMAAFIDGIYISVENAFSMQMERLVATAANTCIANTINGAKARNLLAEYNAAHQTAMITVSEALESPDFLKYAAKEIYRATKNIRKMSVAFNVNGYETFTPKDKTIVEMLAEFAAANDTYLMADTFHNELVALPGYDEIPFWQGSGEGFAFADCSKIDISHDDFKSETNPSGEIAQGGIVCVVRDEEAVAAYFGKRRTWEVVNPRSEVVIHGEKGKKGFAVDSNANCIVFYIMDNAADITASVQAWTEAQLLGGKSAADLQENIVIDNAKRTIAVTLKYVTRYTQFSGEAAEQSGHYLVAKLDADAEGAVISARKEASDTWKELDSNHIIIFRITNANTQKVHVKVKTGRETNYYTYDLSGLTLAPQE